MTCSVREPSTGEEATDALLFDKSEGFIVEFVTDLSVIFFEIELVFSSLSLRSKKR